MSEVKYPGVFVQEPSNNDHTITGVATSIAAFVGWAPSGPSDQATLVKSWSDYANQFGGLDERSLLGYVVNQFFSNGGGQAYIIRLTTDGSVLSPNTAAFENSLLDVNGDGTHGVFLLRRVPVFNLLCVPGESAKQSSSAAVLAQLQAFCVAQRAFLIIDCDQSDTFSMLEAGPSDIITGVDSRNSAYYFPWVQAPDPLQPNQTRAFPPCGFVAGVYAATDASRGVWNSPAGVDAGLIGAMGLTVALTDSENDILNVQAINCLRSFPQHGNVIWGARTLQGNDNAASEWIFIPVRRLALFIESSLVDGTQWAVFEPNNETLWAQLRQSIGAFMHGLFTQGAFQGSTPEQAYFVKCDSENNPQSSVDAGIVTITVGFAPLRPAEFVVIQIQQLAGQNG